jgi:spore coat protein CotF
VEHLVVKAEAAEAKQIVANATTAAVETTTIGIRRSNPTFSGNTPVQID